MKYYDILWNKNSVEPLEDEQVLVMINGGSNFYFVLFYHKDEHRFYHDGKPSFFISEINEWIYTKQLRHLL